MAGFDDNSYYCSRGVWYYLNDRSSIIVVVRDLWGIIYGGEWLWDSWVEGQQYSHWPMWQQYTIEDGKHHPSLGMLRDFSTDVEHTFYFITADYQLGIKKVSRIYRSERKRSLYSYMDNIGFTQKVCQNTGSWTSRKQALLWRIAIEICQVHPAGYFGSCWQ